MSNHELIKLEKAKSSKSYIKNASKIIDDISSEKMPFQCTHVKNLYDYLKINYFYVKKTSLPSELMLRKKSKEILNTLLEHLNYALTGESVKQLIGKTLFSQINFMHTLNQKIEI